MATSANMQDQDMVGPEAVKAPGVPLASVALAVMVAVVAALVVAGGLVYWLAHTGRLPFQATTIKPAAAAPIAAVLKTHPVVLDPLLVNLADAGGNAYLRVAITLQVQDEAKARDARSKDEKPEKGKPVNEYEAAERDAALDAIGRLTAVDLLQTNGKQLLKQKLSAAMVRRVPELKVSEIYFTEFLVQQ